MKKLDKEIIDWHKNTFPDTKIENQLLKLEEEYTEWRQSNGRDIMEAADVYIVATVLKYRFNSEIGCCFIRLIEDGWQYKNIIEAVKEKIEINKNRTWNCKNGIHHHVEEEC